MLGIIARWHHDKIHSSYEMDEKVSPINIRSFWNFNYVKISSNINIRLLEETCKKLGKKSVNLFLKTKALHLHKCHIQNTFSLKKSTVKKFFSFLLISLKRYVLVI